MIKHDGIKSRKLWLSVFSSLLIFAGGVLCVFQPAFATIFPTFCTGVVTLTGFYFGSNLGEKGILGNHEVKIASVPDTKK
jgi:uncharacterized membrane protein HdeD (DUF308 family)